MTPVQPDETIRSYGAQVVSRAVRFGCPYSAFQKRHPHPVSCGPADQISRSGIRGRPPLYSLARS